MVPSSTTGTCSGWAAGGSRTPKAATRPAAGASCSPGSCGTARSASTAAASPSCQPCSPASTWPTFGGRTPRAGSRPWTTRRAPPDHPRNRLITQENGGAAAGGTPAGMDGLMARKRKVGNLLALAVMSYLSQQPMHPYELSRTLREHGDERSIKFNHGSLYMVVGQLAKAGYITEVETTRAGQRPERTVYALTHAARAELRDWLRELVAEPEHEYPD